MKKSFRYSLQFITVITLLFFVSVAYSLTIDEAISLAKESLPSYKASILKVESSEALYKASLSPYLPSLDASASEGRIYASSEEFKTRGYDLSLSYTLFDWGNRKSNRDIARLNLDISKEDLRTSLLDLEYNVKVAFFTALAQKDALEQRKIQLQDAQKDYEVAEGRYKFGVAKLSDTLQSSVRLEQARFNVIQSEGDYRKALSELNSLIGKPLDSMYEIQGGLELEPITPDINKLYEATVKRPEIRQAEDSVTIAERNASVIRSTFLPTFSLNAAYIKTEGDLIGSFSEEEKTTTLKATWNIFELEKFYNLSSANLEKQVATENLNDAKRQLLLEVKKSFEDFVTSLNQMKVAQQQLKQAEYNYSQAFGEYKVGKADILSLVQAESLLANAREQLVSARLNVLLSKALLERVAGIEKIESLNTKG